MTMAQRLPSSLWAVFALALAVPGHAHPRDELGQASYLGITRSAVTVELNLAPGEQLTAAFAALMAKDSYPQQVLSQLSLALDGRPLALRLVGGPVATPEQSTKLYFEAPLPSLSSGTHTLRYENRYQPFKSGYIATTLAGTEGIVIGKQLHDPLQQTLTVEWEAPARPSPWIAWAGGGFLTLCLLYGLSHRKNKAPK